jgi:hypothetical protein
MIPLRPYLFGSGLCIESLPDVRSENSTALGAESLDAEGSAPRLPVAIEAYSPDRREASRYVVY